MLKTIEYKNWKVRQAGIIEAQRRQSFITAMDAAIAKNETFDAAEFGARYAYSCMACVYPVMSYEEFTELPEEESTMLITLVWEVNPHWNIAPQDKKKSEETPSDGTNASEN